MDVAERAPSISSTPVRASRDSLDVVDGLRGLAVLGVIVWHCWQHRLSGLPWPSLGTRGVDLFFVLSGFCLSLGTIRAWRATGRSTLDLRRFIRARIRRIAPPFYAALAVFGGLALTTFGTPASDDGGATLGDFLRAAGLDVAHVPFDPSFWSLGPEMRWYVLFPAILGLYMRSQIGFAALAAVCYVAYAAHGPLDAGTLPCFMLGIVAADLYVRDLHRSPWIAVGAVGVGAVATALQFARANVDHGDPEWHLMALLVTLAGLGCAQRAFTWRPLVFLGTTSYSVYLVNAPIIAWLERTWDCDSTLAGICAVAVGIAFWWAVEVPTTRWAGRILLPGEARVGANARPHENHSVPGGNACQQCA